MVLYVSNDASTAKHIIKLSRFFKQFEFHVYTPTDGGLRSEENLIYESPVFTEIELSKWIAKKNLIFISDCFAPSALPKKRLEIMQQQRTWILLLKPTAWSATFLVQDSFAENFRFPHAGKLSFVPYDDDFEIKVTNTTSDDNFRQVEYNMKHLTEILNYHYLVTRRSSSYMNVLTNTTQPYFNPLIFNRGFDDSYYLFVLQNMKSKFNNVVDEKKFIDFCRELMHCFDARRGW